MTDTIEIWTDGACSGNPGPGGWGAVMRSNGHLKEIYGGDPATTNNRMEMMAVIEALNALKRPAKVTLHVDSTYVKDGLTKWIKGWKRNGWKTADKKPVKNQELWMAMEEACARHDITWKWVKGHSGDPNNDRADELARQGTDEARGRK